MTILICQFNIIKEVFSGNWGVIPGLMIATLILVFSVDLLGFIGFICKSIPILMIVRIKYIYQIIISK